MAFKNLVIVESPTKAKTIEKYLGRQYKVVASKGHLRDLPKSKMGIDIDNAYAPHYITIRGKGPITKELKKYAKKAKNIYLASDPDREGEAIAWHLAYILGLDPKDNIRVTYNEITKGAVKEAFKHPRPIDHDLVDAQQARRILDRLVGYSLSPILWDKVKKGLSAGRVQSVALNLIINREREIKNFKPEEYWTVTGLFKKDRKKFEAKLNQYQGKKVSLSNKDEVDALLKQITHSIFTVKNLKKKKRFRHPQKPFTTSSMQQEASKKLKFRTRKTMMVAQQLYEGVKLGRSSATGLITYMRTDSTRIADNAREEAHKFIEGTYGAEYVGKRKSGKQKSTSQDAHEAIRPTQPSLRPQEIEQYLTKDQYKLYSLIWCRFTASQMASAIYDTIACDLVQNDFSFRANGSKINFLGYQKVYGENNEKDTILPPLENNDEVESIKITPDQHFTQPPARYTEASLIKTLEENGVGRPSTYSPTIETLIKRYYIKIAARRFEPTELGEIVNDIVATYFPDIVDIQFTADLENRLDDIESGKEEWIQVVDNFYQPFSKDLDNAEEKIEKIKIKDEPAGFKCEKCGHEMVIKMGKYGKFYACSNFPECRNTKAIVKKIGVTCPKCQKGDVVERKSKKNRLFYGCNRYPDCDFASWDKPIGRNCPVCGHYLVEKAKRGSKQVLCSHCDYKEDVQKGG